MSSSLPPLLIIVGPTAVGKTALSLEVAHQFKGEIISADSRLFYKGLDIGTAKPTTAEQASVPHHLIDICTPEETLSLGQYQTLAFEKIHDCHQRGKLPILIGGTGQYVMSIAEGWGIPRVPPQQALRQALEPLGQEELGRWLTHLDPIAAEKIDFRNVRRVIRALEVTLTSGVRISTLQIKTPPPFDIQIIGLQRSRENLYERIDQRVDLMINSGLVDEVKGLYDQGYGFHLTAMSGLGYRQFQPYFEENATLEEVVERIKFETHRFARQQHTWFRADDQRIKWFSAAEEQTTTDILTYLTSWLGRS